MANTPLRLRPACVRAGIEGESEALIRRLSEVRGSFASSGRTDQQASINEEQVALLTFWIDFGVASRREAGGKGLSYDVSRNGRAVQRALLNHSIRIDRVG